jgi:subtilisin family serine protease
MDWVVRAKQAGVNVRVMNDSATWPGTSFSQALFDEIGLLGSNDILFVTAAGNTAQNNDTVPRYPCSYNRPNMICVAASDQKDNPWSSSNYGTTTVKPAAGVNIYSTLRLSNYGYITGTSMASPQVAGTAALILSRGYASVASLITTILNNVDPLPSLSSYVSTGGRLNVCKAVPGCTGVLSGTPVNSSPPVVTGVPQYGSLVSASAGLWSGAPTQYRYWAVCQ